jgi:hypothetical protein
MRSPNTEPELVPSASDAERPMPDARRNVSGSTEGETTNFRIDALNFVRDD